MNRKLSALKNIQAENCVTIILNTHRTAPDNQKDPIKLKNMVREAEERLLANESRRDVKQIIEKLRRLESEIDHNHNLDSLLLFVNEDTAEYLRLPLPVKDRVVVDDNFATRDSIRALNAMSNYYVLVLSQQKARLIEASNDKLIGEVKGDFPLENTQFYSTNKVEQSNASRQRNLVAEFFNRVDKALNQKRKEYHFPVLICTEESNYYEYLKIADDKGSLFDDLLKGNLQDEAPHVIVARAWDIVSKLKHKQVEKRKEELQKAVSSNTFLSDVNDIYQAIKTGKVQTLFIEEELFQPAVVEKDIIRFVEDEQRSKKQVIDDIYDELIEMNNRFGGDVVFLPKGSLSEFNGFGAITRY